MKSYRYLKPILAILFLLLLFANPLLAQDDGGEHGSLITSIGIAILAATFVAYLGHAVKQPLLLCYLVAGIIIGPNIGFGFIKNVHDIETISHFGLILLLFLIGLEIDINKLKASGKSLVISGISQFPITAVIGIGFFWLVGFSVGGGKYDLIYIAACCALSSTAIVVKLLYSKFELDTLAGRITLGVLVFQDIWAIILLGIQPNLADPNILKILLSFGKGILLVFMSLAVSKYILPKLFKSIAKVPEMVLVSSLAWCFLVCGGAAFFDLSIEMGALIAGIAISTFPYNLDVIAKVVNIRDFFITLFFVSLGMQIPNPMDNLSILVIAGVASLFLFLSRFLAVFPVLYYLKNGLRVSLLTSINLAQVSEFSLVIASLGLAAGHITHNTMSVIIFVFVITSMISTYMINYSDAIQKSLSGLLKKMGLREIETVIHEKDSDPEKEIALLGFHRIASSLLNDIIHVNNDSKVKLKDKLVVVDFNPEIHEYLQFMGIKVVYGDISHMDTLHHAGIHDVKVLISTIPDTILVGTDNLKIISHMKDICPQAMIIVTAESVERALVMYAEGADYVFLPRILASDKLLDIIDLVLNNHEGEMVRIKDREIEMLKTRIEVIR
ncbi:MAG: cation:proton antiporter [Saprospiraceae bacterium]